MQGFPITRRRFLHGSAALGALGLMRPQVVYGQGTRILKVRAYLDIANLDPADRIGAPDDDVMSAIFTRLIDYVPGDTFDWQLDGAELIEQVDPTHVRFALRRGIPWTNGFGEITAEDVKYSFERIADPEFNAAYHIDWSALDHVEVTETYAGVIVMKEPYAPLWTTSLPYGSGCIVCKAAVEQLDDKRFTVEPPAQAGPYLLHSWTPKQRLVLARNPDWPLDPPYFDEIHIYPIEDFKAAEIAYEAGEVDMAGITLDTAQRYEQSPPPDSELLIRPALAYWWLGQNMKNEVTSDQRVRRAVQMAVDVDEVLEAAFFGAAERSTGIIAPGLIGHRGYNLSKHDPEGARALLAEAGYGSTPLGLRIDCPNSADFVTIAQVVQAHLTQVGIDAYVNPYERGSYNAMQLDPDGEEWRQSQLIVQRYSMAPDPAWATEWFTTGQAWNWMRFESAEYDELHTNAARELDSEKRHEMYVRMQDLLEESGAFLFLTHGSNAYVHRDHLLPAMRADAQNYSFKNFRDA